ncbi:unnamed protein product [Mortierella alpina]
MLQSLMVFPNNNDFFHVGAATMLDDNVAKLMNTDEIDNYLTSASTSPIQDYLMTPSSTYHPQQQNQRQHQLQFSSAITVTTMPPMVPHSAPSSPSYPIIKSEDVQQNNMEYIMFPPTFDHTVSSAAAAPSQGHHIVPSQHSPQTQQQQRMMPFENVSLIQQRQHHQQQQQQHAQQLRLQHQQRAYEQQQYQQQQIMYEPTHSHSAASSMSMTIPVTSSVMTAIAGSATTVTTTSAPFDLSFQRQQQTSYTPAAHPAAPKRKREESGQVQLLPRQTSPQLTTESSPVQSAAAVTANHNVNVLENSPSSLTTKTSAAVAITCSGRLSTSSRLDKVKTTRSTKITKSSFSSTSSSSSATEMITSTAAESKAAAAVRAPKKAPAKKANNTTATAASESRESSQQPENGSDAHGAHLPNSTGNITHPRRAAQNRAAQRTFRNRRKAYIKELEHKVQDMDRTRELMESIHLENQEVWRRLQILEALASQSGLQVPTFPAMTPALLNCNSSNAMTSNGAMPMNSSNDDEEEEEDDDMSDSYSQQHAH